MTNKTYTLDTIIQKPFYKLIYVNGSTIEDFTSYLIDFTLEQELGDILDNLNLVVSRSISNESWFDGFNSNTEIIIRYSNKEIFRGRVKNRNIKYTYDVEVYSCAEITNRKVANKVYNNTSPEDIFEDLINTYTDLHPIITESSGTTIKRFVATDYINSLIQKLSEILGWQIRTDGNKNIYFEPSGNNINSNTLYRTSTLNNAIFGKWEKENNELINRVIIVGDKIEYMTTEYFSGDDSETEFTLTETPQSLGVFISDVEQSENNYLITISDKTITFNTAPTTGIDNIKIEYTYAYPIYCDKKNQTSIDMYGEFVKKLWLSWIKNRYDLINYANVYLDTYSDPIINNILLIPINQLINYTVGELVTIRDDLESINDTFLINKIVTKYNKSKIEMSIGNKNPNFSTIQGYMQSRIKELEKDIDLIVQLYETPTETLEVSETLTEDNINYINYKLYPIYPIKCNYSRGSVHDARLELCQIYGLAGYAFNEYGFTSCGYTTSNVGTTEHFDDTANTHTARTDATTARRSLSGYALNGYGFTSCGYITSNVGTTERFDDTANTHTARTDATTARHGLTGYSLNGYGFTSCGYIGGGVGTTERFDDTANTHTARTNATARYTLAGYALNGYGFTSCGDLVGTTERFDDAANTHTARTDATVRKRLAGYSLNGYGFTSCGEFVGLVGTTERFDDVTNTHTARTDATARRHLTGYASDGYGFTSCGDTPSNVGTTERFDDNVNTHTTRTDAIARHILTGY